MIPEALKLLTGDLVFRISPSWKKTSISTFSSHFVWAFGDALSTPTGNPLFWVTVIPQLIYAIFIKI
jgi:hypothetical protein